MQTREELLLEVALTISNGRPNFHDGPFKDGYNAAIEECLCRIDGMRRGSYLMRGEDGVLELVPFGQDSTP